MGVIKGHGSNICTAVVPKKQLSIRPSICIWPGKEQKDVESNVFDNVRARSMRSFEFQGTMILFFSLWICNKEQLILFYFYFFWSWMNFNFFFFVITHSHILGGRGRVDLWIKPGVWLFKGSMSTTFAVVSSTNEF